ncbi:hypothetical protein Mgra_00003646 [Meloidogyne graminicola]|uniref:FGF n=1 Tax=Meloidogyne graminicola TaxID=189291 RepID=A0A8S9ZUF1_9BILA|nr:hypothetical protein Mgra_00003646 [Meloidogyne graminicola]
MRPFSNYYSSTTTTALAFLTTIPLLWQVLLLLLLNNLNNSPTLLLPPFNSTDSKLITKCSIRAQQKQRKNQNIGKNSISTSLSLLERLGMGEEEQNVEPPSLSVLPIRQVRYEHAHRRGALYCKSGNWLEISNNNNIDGSDVRGTRNKNNNHFTIFEFLAVAFGLVSIKAVANQHFLCMDSKGNLYASPEKNYNAECVFLEEMHPQVYNLYSSCSYGYPKRPWFVALSRNGRPRRGKSTKKGQMSTHFVLIDEGNNNKKEILWIH